MFQGTYDNTKTIKEYAKIYKPKYNTSCKMENTLILDYKTYKIIAGNWSSNKELIINNTLQYKVL